MIVEKVYQRGASEKITYTWEVQPDKPRMWVEGHEYKFNSRLVKVTNERLKNDCTGGL